MKKKIAIFASGSGSNAENIAQYFQNSEIAEVTLILSNNKNAFVLERAKKLNINSIVFNKEEFQNNFITNILISNKIDFVVLAGFLLLIPVNVIKIYRKRIVNIHPALLPDYGGKGMYGDFVHKKVIEDKQKESGITIHFVNEKYDDGQIIFQAKCAINEYDTAEILAKKIHSLEYEYFPKTIEKLLKNNLLNK